MYTFWKRPTSSRFLSAQFYMVCAKCADLRTRLPALGLSDLFVPGILVVLFFRCMAALFNPTHHRGRGIKWGLVSYTVIMFLVGTVVSGMDFHIRSNSYIDNPEFPGVGDALPPGPLGYQSFIFSDAPTIVFNSMFFLNGWLADGLLVNLSFVSAFNCLSQCRLSQLYRCYVIYSANLWVVALPCLMHLGSLGAYSSPYNCGIQS